MVKAALLEIYWPQEVHHRLGWVARDHKIGSYADDDHIVGYNRIRFYMTLAEVVRMFERAGMQMKLGKTKVMVFTPCFI